VSFCFRFNPHPASLDRPIGRINRLYIGDIHTWLARCYRILSVIVNIDIIVNILIAACGPLIREFATHFIASILRAARVPLFPVPRLSTPPPVCRGAAHPLSRHQPRRRTTRTIFPIPTRLCLLLAPLLLSCTRSLYLLREFTDQHDRLDHDERSVSRLSVKIFGVYSIVCHVFSYWTYSRSTFLCYVSFDRYSANTGEIAKSTYPLCLSLRCYHNDLATTFIFRVNSGRLVPHAWTLNSYGDHGTCTVIDADIDINIVVTPAKNRHHLHHRRSRGLLDGDAVR